MTAWSMIVAERQGFKREEALSIGVFRTSTDFTDYISVVYSICLHRNECPSQRGVTRNIQRR